MIKHKKQSKLIALIVCLVVALALVLASSVGTMSAFATNTIYPPQTMSFTVPRTVAYMDSMSPSVFGVTGSEELRVTKPDGSIGIAGDAGFTVFDQIGVYTLEFINGAGSTVFATTIRAEIDADFELRVENGGAAMRGAEDRQRISAGIPTVINAEREFRIPNAFVYYRTSAMEEFERLTAQRETELGFNIHWNIQSTTREPGRIDNLTMGGTHYYEEVGFYTIRYSARIDAAGATGTKFLTESFGVRVQSAAFVDDTAPTLSVVAPPSSISINTRVTLATATATDDYDENVFVEVRVYDPNDNPVQVARVNERTGLAHGTYDRPVEFDNAYTMYFYPTQLGRYTIQYVAWDDFGNHSSLLNQHIVNAEDRSAPILQNIDDFRIPSTWGLTVSRLNVNSPATNPRPTSLPDRELYIRFPWPEFVDNGARMVDGEWDDNIQRVSFEIRDTVNNQVVVRFDNIWDQEGAGSSFTFAAARASTQGYYDPGETVRFDREEGFLFNFLHYIDNDLIDVENFDGLGRYTAQFLARDGANISTTRTYDITLVNDFTDITPPMIEVNYDTHIYIHSDTEFITVPTAIIRDTQSDRLDIDFRVIPVDENGDIVGGADNFLRVEANERLEVVYDGLNTQLRNADARFYEPDVVEADAARLAERTITLTGAVALEFRIEAFDSVRNRANNFEDDFEEEDRIVPLVLEAGLPTTVNLNADGIAVGTVNLTDGLYNLGGFRIEGVTEQQRNFTGFEISITDEEGEVYEIYSLHTFFRNNNIYVENILVDLLGGRYDDQYAGSGTPPRIPTEYNLNIRAFNMRGVSSAVTFMLSVDRPGLGGGTPPIGLSVTPTSATASTAIGTEGRINARYTLHNSRGITLPMGHPDELRFMVREIKHGTHFSLMGSEFTAHAQGAFTFADGFFMNTTVNDRDFRSRQVYSITFTSDDNIEFGVQGIMPVHEARSTREYTNWIELPRIVAFNANARAEITPIVTGPRATGRLVLGDYSGAEMGSALQRMSNDEEDIDYNRFRFRADRNGIYTVQFEASVGGVSRLSDVFEIRVGNVVAMPITVVGAAAEPELSEYFLFNEVEYYADFIAIMQERDIDAITFTKRLMLGGSVLFEVSERGSSGASRTTDDANPDGFFITETGEYTVEYITTDSTGENIYVIIHSFTVQGEGARVPWPLRVLSTVLTILVVLIIASIILYVVRFRRLKVKRNKAAQEQAGVISEQPEKPKKKK